MAHEEPTRDSQATRQGAESANETLDQDSQQVNYASSIIVPYLSERVFEFRKLNNLRRAGWSNPEADKFFQRQRQNADLGGEKNATYFFTMMKKIATELHKETNALNLQKAGAGNPPRILDMCMAPGGFLSTVMNYNRTAHALAFTLPLSKGGHKVLIPKTSAIKQCFLDVTMLAADMGLQEIPSNHTEANSFLPKHFDLETLFDIALCDGQVLRTHAREAYRERHEAKRLTCTQLALSLEHLRPGGTMVVLLHRVETWTTIKILKAFHEFSSITLVKPKTNHAKRSSFYMVATKVQSRHPAALQAVEKWKKEWKRATFGLDKTCEEELFDSDIFVNQVIEEFGDELIRLGRRVWQIQAAALEKAPFTRQ